MIEFTTFTTENAPKESREIMEQIEQIYGFVPALIGRMAASPVALRALGSLKEIYENCSLNPVERKIVLLITSVENKSNVCIAAHSMELRQNLKANNALIEAARSNAKLPDDKMNNLAEFVREAVRNKGEVSENTRQNFFRAGFSQQQALEVIVGITIENLTSYTGHLVQAPVDEQLANEAPKAAA